MKTSFLTTLAIAFSFVSQAQIVNIPDANFKSALIELGFDTNTDGEIQVSEAEAVTSALDVSFKDISDLTGIEAFINISGLECNDNQLNNLDLSSNTALTYLACHSNQLTNLDVSANIDLTNLWCLDNQLTSLDISYNTAITMLKCENNQLTSLDLISNTALTYLDCDNNQLTSLDLSSNTALTRLYCYNNQLTGLDVSNNTALTDFWCASNQLTSLDASNTAFAELHCSNNQLTSLNLKNGNNQNIEGASMINNPDLYCIQVDAGFQLSESSIDPWASVSDNCLYGITYPNYLSGTVLKDDNCIIDASPQGLRNIIVRTEPEHYYGITDSSGTYTITTDTGTYQVNQIITHPFIVPLCPAPNYHTVVFDTLSLDTTGLNFFNEVIECPLLTVDLNSDRRRRCFTNNTYVEYCNTGFANASDVEVTVEFPEYVILISANYSYTIDASGNYIFDIGNLAMGECGNIHIIDSVACIDDITGLTQCTKAWITPPNDCLDNLDTTSYNAWDKSSVMVTGECTNDTLINFTITNTGDFGEGDMETSQEYRIFVDNALDITDVFQLNGEESITIAYPANGQTIRLEADQHPMHPGNSHPQETIEACGNNSENVSMGFVSTFPQDDADYDIEIDCMEIRDSYDPNDKKVSPEGITDNHYIVAGTELDYQIRFQNTGSDTAYTVIIIDTLSAYLNPSTIQWGISSHPYTVDVTGIGTPVLHFTFNNINLPDSTTNELASQGFVKFKVASYDTLANGTEINNTAHIFFDYNTAIITNTSQLIVSDTVLVHIPLLVLNKTKNDELNIYPNPTTGKITIEGENIVQIEIYNLSGVLIQSTNKKEIDLSQETKGIYFVKITTANGVATQKLIVE